jgi:HAD superfamily hydrolase (TIGR01490 family)
VIVPGQRPEKRLALFDLDHTLLSGDSDLLWCEHLLACGLLDESYRERSERMSELYGLGTVAPPEYCAFHASTLAGHRVGALRPVRLSFFEEVVKPRIPADARALLQRHRDAGDTLLLTTATSHAVSELTAADLGVDHFLATDVEVVDGCYTGRVLGVPNMRTGKVERLRQWLQQQGLAEQMLRKATFYSDSINDLPLLSVVGRPMVVDPDVRLESTALRKGWTVLHFDRRR